MEMGEDPCLLSHLGTLRTNRNGSQRNARKQECLFLLVGDLHKALVHLQMEDMYMLVLAYQTSLDQNSLVLEIFQDYNVFHKLSKVSALKQRTGGLFISILEINRLEIEECREMYVFHLPAFGDCESSIVNISNCFSKGTEDWRG